MEVPFSRSMAICADRGSSNWTKPKLRRRTGGSARRPCFAKILSISATVVFSVAKFPMKTLQYGGKWEAPDLPPPPPRSPPCPPLPPPPSLYDIGPSVLVLQNDVQLLLRGDYVDLADAAAAVSTRGTGSGGGDLQPDLAESNLRGTLAPWKVRRDSKRQGQAHVEG